MELQSILLCAVVLSLASCQLDGGQSRAIADYQDDGASDVTVCPEDYSPRDDCVTLDQLISGNLIKSDTTFKFKPAAFEMKAGSVIRFENVNNITIKPAGAYNVDITCVGNNSGFTFQNVSGLTIRNMMFSKCMVGNDSTLVVSESSDIMLKNLTFRHGSGGGISADNMDGYFTIMDSLFTHMQGTGLSLNMTDDQSEYDHHYSSQRTLTITNSQFDSHYHNAPASYDSDLGGIVYATRIRIAQGFTTTVLLEDITITNNTHRSDSSGIFISSASELHMTVKGINCTNNLVIGDLLSNTPGASVQADFYLYISDRCSINITDSNFINNGFNTRFPVAEGFYIEHSLYEVLHFSATDAEISIRNSTIGNNTGLYDAAILVKLIFAVYEQLYLNFLLESSTIANNTIYVPDHDYNERGAVQLNSVGVTIDNCSVVNNSATGLLLYNSVIEFSGYNTIRGNKGNNGGGMALYADSTFELASETTLLFEDNLAESKGGGLFVQEVHSIINGDTFCSFLVENIDSVTIHFSNNSAKTAGNDWYGGNLYCTYDNSEPGWKVVTSITDCPANYTMDLTSDPIHVCDCSTESSLDCINVTQTVQTIHTYPGKSFNLSLLAVGQLLKISPMSGVSTAIYADLLPLHKTSGSIPDDMRVQNGARRCSNLTYRVSSSNVNETMVLSVADNIDRAQDYFLALWQKNSSKWIDAVQKLLLQHSTIPAYMSVYLQPCPVGFGLLEQNICDCSSLLTNFVLNCSIDTMLITRKSPVWLSAANDTRAHDEGKNMSVVYLIHPHCLFDYCLSGDFDFSLADPDAQCNHNRSGILCGKCKPGYSLTLGTNECKQCTNIYLLLLIPFGLAGVFLVVFLSLTDMTVTAGTINGLLFFANIVRENHTTFFPSQAAETLLTVFIAWLNLDLGISSCFYDGLDAYALTLLQLSFPIYLWVLAFGIIIASRHFAFMNKLCGQNIVHVLATLFLLSYTKIQRHHSCWSVFHYCRCEQWNKIYCLAK